MRSMLSRNHERLSGGEWRPSPTDQASASRNGTHVSNRSDIYARPDVYDMEYEGASNEDAHFFARMAARFRPRRVLELACGSGRVTFTLAAALPKAEIVGVDRSIEMLSQAVAARDAAESSVRQRVWFVKGRPFRWARSRHNASPYPVNGL
jgi:ubiquinone/menaquinone biosynthesis C-methylase UbiE